MESILNSIKELLGVSSNYTAFDSEIKMGINSSLATLHQLGVGPDEGFFIEDDTEVWSDFIDDSTLQKLCKQYVQLKTRLFFDPPTNSTMTEIITKNVDELVWRIANHVEIIGEGGE